MNLTGVPVNMINIKRWLSVFEIKKTKTVAGGLLSVASLVLAVGIYPIIKQAPVSALEPTKLPIEITTASLGPSIPLPAMTGVSQGFWSEHPGVDITAPLGSAIFPIKPGRVIEVSISKFNYGRSVVIDHGNNLTSRYAHMGKIMVQEGDEVDAKTELGEVGVTGHTTGPHLHLEIRRNEVALNPLAYLHSNLLASK